MGRYSQKRGNEAFRSSLMGFDASDRVCAVVFGKRIEVLRSHHAPPDWMEGQITTFNYESDENLDAIEKKLKPNAYVTFGDWRQYVNLCAAPFEVRKKWVNFNGDESLESIGEKIYDTYRRQCFEPNETKPLVSVITPTYKAKDKIFRPLQSLQEQTYKNWEWILYDDSDDDGETYDLLSQLSQTDHRIKAFRGDCRSGRIGQVKKNAFSLGSGEFLCELDHDDILTNNCLSWLVESFSKYPDAGMCYTDCAEFVEATGGGVDYGEYAFGYGGYRKEFYKGQEYLTMNYPRLNQKTIRHIVGVANHVRCWRFSVYHEVGGHNPNLHVGDDYDLIVKTFLKSRICHIPRLGYIQYCNRDQSNTTDRRRPEIQRIVEMIRRNYDRQIHDRLLDLGLPDDIWDESSGASNIWADIPKCHRHACIISDV